VSQGGGFPEPLPGLRVLIPTTFAGTAHGDSSLNVHDVGPDCHRRVRSLPAIFGAAPLIALKTDERGALAVANNSGWEYFLKRA
jgi:hypothetical protein